MSDEAMLAYVRASAQLMGLTLDDARAQRVALHLGRTSELAKLLDDFALAPEDEPAVLFHPGPHPGRHA